VRDWLAWMRWLVALREALWGGDSGNVGKVGRNTSEGEVVCGGVVDGGIITLK
jgi:hypothetical protein